MERSINHRKLGGEGGMTAREQAHKEAMRLNIAAIADKLQDVLGQQLTAYAVGLKDPRTIGKYAREVQKPSARTATRLRHLYIITQVLLTRETAETVRAWMIGSHPLLQDQAPAELLHAENHPPVDRTARSEAGEGQVPSPYQSVARAAEEFVAAR